jgi:hypothetical protein
MKSRAYGGGRFGGLCQAFACAAICVACFSHTSKTLAETSATPSVDRRLADYYVAPNPGTVKSVVELLNSPKSRKKWNDRGATVGFLSEVWRTSDSSIKEITRHRYEPISQLILAQSLWFAGRADELTEFVTRHGWDEKRIRHLRQAPRSVLGLAIRGSNDLDIHWGAFSASGNPEYVAEIIKFIRKSVDEKTSERDLIEASSRLIRGLPNTSLFERLNKGMTKGQLPAFLIKMAALWGLASNARQHPAVAKFIARHLRSNAEIAGRLALKWAAFYASSPRTIVAEKNAGIGVVILAGRDRDLALQFVKASKSAKTRDPAFKDKIIRETRSGQAVFANLLLYRPAACGGRVRFSLVDPAGREWDYRPKILSAKNTQSLQALFEKFELSSLGLSGAYKYIVRFEGCGLSEWNVENGFFVY